MAHLHQHAMLELHIWGPVFGVPSIDAECIAAITYLHNAVQDDSAWRIVPSNDAAVSPSGEFFHSTCFLPLLRLVLPAKSAHAPLDDMGVTGFPSLTRPLLRHMLPFCKTQPPCSFYVKHLTSMSC